MMKSDYTGKPSNHGGYKENFTGEFNPEWIKTGVNMDTVNFAEKFGKYLADNGLTTSQIRNIFGEIKRIQMKKFEYGKSSFYLLKPKMAYAEQRNKNGISELRRYFDKAHAVVTDDKTFNNFVDFFEAILAYHKAFGGRD